MGVKLDKATRERLKTLGKAKDRSTHWLLRKAIDEYLEREERWEREKQDDAQRWQRFVETGEAYELHDVKVWLKDLSGGKKRQWPR